MTSLIKTNKLYRLNVLMELRGKLRFYGYDELNLVHLDALRSEVQNRIDDIVGKKEPLETAKPHESSWNV